MSSFHKEKASQLIIKCSVIDNRDTTAHAFVLRSFEFLDSSVMPKSSLCFNHNTKVCLFTLIILVEVSMVLCVPILRTHPASKFGRGFFSLCSEYITVGTIP